MPTVISREAVVQHVENGTATLVEALPEAYWRKEHLPGAINIPHDQVDALAEQLLADKDANVVVYCANTPCSNSTQAAQRLIQLGYRNVFDYVEGKQDWIENGHAVESADESGPLA